MICHFAPLSCLLICCVIFISQCQVSVSTNKFVTLLYRTCSATLAALQHGSHLLAPDHVARQLMITCRDAIHLWIGVSHRVSHATCWATHDFLFHFVVAYRSHQCTGHPM
jgi:hypothetical protein